MMTCVSERSGMASSEVCSAAYTPNPAAIRTPATVSTRFLAHQAITRSITSRLPFLRGRLELALGRDEEVARGHDDLAGLESCEHFKVVAGPAAKLHLARSQPTAADVHEH